MISQVQTRGDGGGNDEFVELYNPNNSSMLFDSSWSVGFRSAIGVCTANAESERIAGMGQLIPAHGYLLLTNGGYGGTVAGDATYSVGLMDSGSLVLRHGGVVVDALCFHFDATTQTALTTCTTAYACEGTPLLNPHNNTTGVGSNLDASLMRRTGQDTQDNTNDFVTATPSVPHNRLGPSAP